MPPREEPCLWLRNAARLRLAPREGLGPVAGRAPPPGRGGGARPSGGGGGGWDPCPPPPPPCFPCSLTLCWGSPWPRWKLHGGRDLSTEGQRGNWKKSSAERRVPHPSQPKPGPSRGHWPSLFLFPSCSRDPSGRPRFPCLLRRQARSAAPSAWPGSGRPPPAPLFSLLVSTSLPSSSLLELAHPSVRVSQAEHGGHLGLDHSYCGAAL